MSHIEVLQRRIDWLTDRIAKATGDTSYDRAERKALRAAISMLKHHEITHSTCRFRPTGGSK